MTPRHSLLLACCAAMLCAGTAWGQCAPDEVIVAADRDNTLIEDTAGTLSNGAGSYFFAGRTAQGSDEIRRGLVHFDVASAVAAGSTIDSAMLTLILSMAADPSLLDVSLHNLQTDWGEGTSQGSAGEGGGAPATTGDATWTNTFFDTADWVTAGGDFDALASATTGVASPGTYAWSSAAMAADAQAWLDDPATNYGWLVQGDESASATAKRFGSKDNGNAADQPVLCLAVTAPPATAEIPTIGTWGLLLLALALVGVALRRFS